MTKEARVVAAVLWFTLVVLCSLFVRNTEAVNAGNDLGERQEYQRVLIGCNSAGALTSENPMLRKLCDEYLLEIAEKNDE